MPSDNAEYVRCFGCFIKENSVDWMTRRELSLAIPPAYTEFIGRQLIETVADV